MENAAHLAYRGAFLFVKRLEILHVREVVLHLSHGAHARKDHKYAVKSRGKAYCVACRTAAVQRIKYRARIIWKVYKISALDRLHYDDRLAVLAAYLIALAGLHCGILKVNVVELYLHDLDLGVGGKYLVKHLGAVVEGKPDMLYLSLGFEGERRLVCAAFFEFFEYRFVLRVHEIKIKVVNAARFKLALEKGTDIFFAVEEVACQLVGKDVALARVALCQPFAHRYFAFAAEISVRGVKIVEALCDKGVNHA